MKLKGKNYWVLLCDCSKYGDKDMLICGIYGNKEEAREVNQEIKSCPARHKIKLCNIVINLI